MSVTSYVTSLIKHFTTKEKKVGPSAIEIRWTERWFGILPFLWRWVITEQKK